MVNKLRDVEIKLMRGLLDLVVLQFLKAQPMHGYQIITKFEKTSESISGQAQSILCSTPLKRKISSRANGT